jgi:hypothetical protein
MIDYVTTEFPLCDPAEKSRLASCRPVSFPQNLFHLQFHQRPLRPPEDEPNMDLHDAHSLLTSYVDSFSEQFQRLPGSAIFLRYVKSSYQNDPFRSALELFLFLIVVRFLLASRYPTKSNVVALSEAEIDELVEDWTPEPLVGKSTGFEEVEVERRVVISGLVFGFL